MADVLKTIGSDARDYPDLITWEAALGGAAGGSGNDAIGEGYDDSVFDEVVIIDDSTPDSITLTVEANERHDGTDGSGTRIVRTGSGRVIDINNTIPTKILWWEIDGNGNDGGGTGGHVRFSSTTQQSLERCLVHGFTSTGFHRTIHLDSSNIDILDNIIYDIVCTSGAGAQCYGIYDDTFGTINILNNTIHDIVNNNGSGPASGIQIGDDVANTIQNNIVTDTAGTTSGTVKDYNVDTPANATMDHNLASDTTASGTGSLDSKTSANQFVSNSAPYDLHIKTGADAIDAGVDLGAVDAAIDINGRNRDTEGDIWDMGAHELVAVAAGVEIFRRRIEGY